MFRLREAALALKSKGLRDYRDRERAKFAGERGDDWRGSAACSAAESCGDEDHVGTFERLDDLLRVFESGFATDLGIGAGAKSLGQFGADLQLHGRLRQFKRLLIGIGGDEFDALHLGADHAVHGVASATPNADDLDLRALQALLAER